MQQLRPDPQEIRRSLNILFPDPGTVFEGRWLAAITSDYTRTHTRFGYYTEADRYIEDARKIKASGSYVTLQSVLPDVFSRSANHAKVAEKGSGTKDHEIVAYRWLLVDLDPKRPAGVSSNEMEHGAALLRAQAISKDLKQFGWPDPVVADSGNGTHLLYRIDVPSDDAGRDLIKGVLNTLADKHSDALVDIDRSVFNPGRIVKMYGTPACKGDSTTDRPHRLSRLLSIPECIKVVPRELLEKLAGGREALKTKDSPKVEASPRAQAGQGDSFIDTWMKKFLPDAEGPQPWNGGRIWTPIECPWRPQDGRGSFVAQHESGAISAGCPHATCPGSRSTGNHWHDLRDLLEGPGWRKNQPDRPPEGTPCPDPLHRFDLSEWGLRPAPAVRPLITNLLAAGEACLLVGPPNAGKGLLSLQIAVSIAIGSGLFGKAGPGKSLGVILVQMEDSAEEMERRWARLYQALRAMPEWSDQVDAKLRRNMVILGPNWNSDVAKSMTSLAPFILKEAEAFKARDVEVGLIIIDTMTAVSEGDENSVEAQRATWPHVYTLRDKTGATVMLIHHVRKALSGNSTPPIIERLSPDAIRGSSSNNAAARAILQIEPLRPNEAAKLGLDSEKARRGGFVLLAQTKVVSGPKGEWVLLEQQTDGFWAPHSESDRLCAELQGKGAVEDFTRDQAILLSIADGCQDRKELGRQHWPTEPPARQAELVKAALNRLRNRHGWVQRGNSMDLTVGGFAKADTLRRNQPGNQKEPDHNENGETNALL